MTRNAIYRRIVGDTGFRTVDAGDFKESDHPRDESGKFTSGGGGGGANGGSSKSGRQPKAEKSSAENFAAGMEKEYQKTQASASKFPEGSYVRSNVKGSRPAKVIGHEGNMIITTEGMIHATKAVAAEGGASEKPKAEPKAAAANVKEAENPRETLEGMSAPKLKAAINSAVEKFGIDGSWSAPKTNGKEELIEHINGLCNEHNLRVTENGSLEKPNASASTVKTNNEGYGFHGKIGQQVGADNANAAYSKMAGEVKKLTGADDKTVRDYLDSRHGRHLGDVVESTPDKGEVDAYVKKDFKTFLKHYDPADYS